MELLKRLGDGRAHWLVGVIATLGQTLRRRYLNRIYRDRDGHWINVQRGQTFVNSSYGSISVAEVESKTKDIWCFYDEIRPGDVVIDIGAGVGEEAVVLSRYLGPNGRLVAIEAHPQTFACLEKCVRLNRLDNVSALQVAVSDKADTLYMTDVESHVANRVDAESGIPVSARTLDDILTDLGISKPTLVKMNIEGAEVAALRGAEQTLQAGSRWIVSCHDFIAGDDPALKTYGAVTKRFRDAGLTVRQPRTDRRPWIPFYVYAERTSG